MYVQCYSNMTQYSLFFRNGNKITIEVKVLDELYPYKSYLKSKHWSPIAMTTYVQKFQQLKIMLPLRHALKPMPLSSQAKMSDFSSDVVCCRLKHRLEFSTLEEGLTKWNFAKF